MHRIPHDASHPNRARDVPDHKAQKSGRPDRKQLPKQQSTHRNPYKRKSTNPGRQISKENKKYTSMRKTILHDNPREIETTQIINCRKHDTPIRNKPKTNIVKMRISKIKHKSTKPRNINPKRSRETSQSKAQQIQTAFQIDPS